MIRPMSVVGVFLFALAPVFADAPPLALKGARVLVCAGYFDLMNIPALQRLRAAGAEVRGGNLADLQWDTAKHYHLIIAIGINPKDDEAVPVLEQFVKAGGGLLFFRHYSESDKADVFLKPFGAAMPWELIQDPTHTYKCPTGFNLAYAFTEGVATNHPVTAGVKTVWYSAGETHLFHTSPVKVSKDWTVLVSGAKEANTKWVGGLNEEHRKKPGEFPSAPPFIAAREYGAGAIVLVGISPMEVFFGQGLPAYQDIALEKGDGMRPSDLRRLYENSLHWLTHHARQSVAIGQGELKPQENGWAQANVPDWSKDVFGGDLCTKPARGVIGAHSKLSDGKAAPQALIKKAKTLGLQWIAFTERLEDFTPKEWEKLRKTCREHSTPDFAALPGLDYADATGTRYVVFGDFDWPPVKVFSADKKQIVVPQWWFNIGVPPLGPYNLSHAPLRYWDFSLYNFLAIRTTIAGKQVDDTMEGFRHMQGVMDDPFPMAVEMVYDEKQLTAAAERMGNFVTRDSAEDMSKFYRDLNYYGSYRGFVSDGPLVTDWRAHNETRVTGGKWWLPGTEQYRVKLAVHSTAPITDIRIYDGPRLFRRIRPPAANVSSQTNHPPTSARGYVLAVTETNGVQKVNLTFDLPHDQQRNLFAEITDANGKRAVTGGLFIRDWLNWRFMCSDRGNSICDAVQVDEAGPYLTGPTAPYQRKMTVFGVFPGYGERHFNILPPDFDGGMRPVGMGIMPGISAEGLTIAPPNSTLEQRMEVPVCSRDGLLQGETLTGFFPCIADCWQNKCTPQDIQDVRIRYRYLNITARPHDPGVVLLEGRIRFERAMKLNSLSVFNEFPTSRQGEVDHFAIVTPEVNVAGISAPTPFSASAKMIPGSYVCVFPSVWGSSGAMALDDGYLAVARSKTPGNHIGVQLAGLPREVAAGEEIQYRLVLIQGSGRAQPNTADWEQFAQTMGFRGQPAYEVKDVRVGTVKGTKFLLELAPADGGFVGTITQADLPIRLPVRVADMNPNWTFAWFDLDRKEWFPSAVDFVIHQGYFTFDTRRGPHRFFAGHPILADNPDVRIAVLSDAKSEVRATLNNVGDQPVKVTARLNSALGQALPQMVELAPGEMKSVTFSVPIQ